MFELILDELKRMHQRLDQMDKRLTMAIEQQKNIAVPAEWWKRAE